MGMLASELPDSATEYQRYKGYDAATALATQKREYNAFWADNVPYVDIPNDNVKKISYYRTWENRFNTFDGNIPGNDYQFPVDLEGALGYNNQITLTVPMRMQDLKWWTDPLWSYSQWLSQGEESGCQAFHDNPGNTANWNNTYEQWTADEAFKSYMVHGGPKSVLRNLAKYSECDVKGTLAKFDTNRNGTIEYSSGTLPGNDADSVAFQQYGTRPQDRTETSFWYSGAKATAAEYRMLGDDAKAAEMDGIADNIKSSILTNLWANGPITTPGGQATGPRAEGQDRQGRQAQRQRRVDHAPAERDRHAQRRLVGLHVGEPAGEHDVVAHLRLRHRHDALHVPHRQRRLGDPLRHQHRRRRRRRAGDQRHRHAAAEPVVARRRRRQWHHRHALRQRQPGRDQREHDAAPVRPGQHDPELDRPLAVRRPAAARHRGRLQRLRPRAQRGRRHDAGRRRPGRG